MFLDFIEVESEVRELLERRMDVAYRMERLRPKVRPQHIIQAMDLFLTIMTSIKFHDALSLCVDSLVDKYI